MASTVSVFSHKRLNLTYDTIQFVDEIRVIAVLPKRGHKGSVIPKGAVFFSTESLELFSDMHASAVFELSRRIIASKVKLSRR